MSTIAKIKEYASSVRKNDLRGIPVSYRIENNFMRVMHEFHHVKMTRIRQH